MSEFDEGRDEEAGAGRELPAERRPLDLDDVTDM